MIEIKLDKEKEHIFELIYNLKEYIPQAYFNKYEQYVEVNFFKDLFAMNPKIKFLGKQKMIWTIHFYYEYQDKKFGLVLDEDYDIVSFFTEKIDDREVIAEFLVLLIQNQKNIRES
ncbi:hypothetical protein [Clostridium sp. OS1-26]|uniref:hypothetical protein n=1 Tax=Clostridium sp. OS1-26 TaxID=3070681 RepID=UPI0027DF84E3|nr:hypothetical protein [Clostridium sp. OS1-26]WML33473.1 hypothetical protein RCG18_19270 [Clostridium sp. OS1-26]